MLLSPRPADKTKYAGEQVFRKYISSMLDLLVPHNDVRWGDGMGDGVGQCGWCGEGVCD